MGLLELDLPGEECRYPCFQFLEAAALRHGDWNDWCRVRGHGSAAFLRCCCSSGE